MSHNDLHISISDLLNVPTLPHLALVVDEREMANRFSDYLRAAGVPPEWQVTDCTIERIYYKPGRRCSVLYRLNFVNESGEQANEWFFARMSIPGHGQKRFRREKAAVKESRITHSFLRSLEPVSQWSDLNLILWVFPHDIEMKTLAHAIQPELIQECFVDHRDEIMPGESGESWKFSGTHFKRLKYLPGKRCVLKQILKLEDSSGRRRKLSIYSKTYHDAMSRYHFQFMQSAREELMSSPGIHIPKPILHIDHANTTWFEDWGGEPLIEVHEQYYSDELYPVIADLVAAFHASGMKELRPAPEPAEIFQHSFEDGMELVKVLPRWKDNVTETLDRLRFEMADVEVQDKSCVPIHGAFRLEQLLVKKDDIAIVDFDALALGDPLLDIAEFIASLHFLELSKNLSFDSISVAVEIFLEAYRQQVGWRCSRKRIAWYALCFFISKLYLALKQLDLKTLNRFETSNTEMISYWSNELSSETSQVTPV